jgi:hypothetical protein
MKRCHLCRAREDIEELYLVSELWWCVDKPGCNHRARQRLHMRGAESELLMEAERGGAATAPGEKPRRRDPSAKTTDIRPLVRLLRQDSMMSKRAAEEALGQAIHWRHWKAAHVACYEAIGRRDLAWTARQ